MKVLDLANQLLSSIYTQSLAVSPINSAPLLASDHQVPQPFPYFVCVTIVEFPTLKIIPISIPTPSKWTSLPRMRYKPLQSSGTLLNTG